MPTNRRGLVAPQNTFLEIIIRRYNSLRKYWVVSVGRRARARRRPGTRFKFVFGAGARAPVLCGVYYLANLILSLICKIKTTNKMLVRTYMSARKLDKELDGPGAGH